LFCFRFIIILTAFSFQIASAQKKVKVDEKVRLIEYHVLSEQENSGFFRKNQELSRIILEAAMGDEIAAYQIDYEKWTEFIISPITLKTRLQKINEPGLDEIYQADEVSLIGLDVTEGYKDDQVFRQYNFLNLYVPYYHSTTTHNIYVASFLFDEVIALLDNRNALWYSESYVLSRGIFTNHAGHELSKTSWSKHLLEDIKLGHLKARFNAGVNISGYQAIDGYDLDVSLVESKAGKYFPIDSIELYRSENQAPTQEDLFICSISFDDFSTHLSKSDPQGIILISEAIMNRILTSPSEIWRNPFENFYDTNFKDKEIVSKNGRYSKNEGIDNHSTGNQLQPQKVCREKISNRRFTVHQTEFVNINRNENSQFRNLIKSILNSAFNGSLDIYREKSMMNKMPPNEFKSCFISQSDIQLELIYNLNFDINGEKRSYNPKGIGLVNSDGVTVYFNLDELQAFLNNEQIKMLSNRHITGILHETSHISLLE